MKHIIITILEDGTIHTGTPGTLSNNEVIQTLLAIVQEFVKLEVSK